MDKGLKVIPMIKLTQIKELYDFEPRYSFSQMEFLFLPGNQSEKIEDDNLYKAVQKLTGMAYPTEAQGLEEKWIDFYFPLKRRGYLILIPLRIDLYYQNYFLYFRNSQIEVCEGKSSERNDIYLGLIEQTQEFSRIIRSNPGIVQESVPYDIRTGNILGKYIMREILSSEEKEEISETYSGYIMTLKKLRGVTFQEYLDTAAICYRAAFGHLTDGMTSEEMYRKWADKRDCGMLDIKDKNSKKEFSNWLVTKSNCGGHPFEIIFSWHGHGIHLMPPDSDRPYFSIRVTDYTYAKSFIMMVKALIENKIPFYAYLLNKVLDYMSGESYFRVNAYDKHFILYGSDLKKILKHIEWDDLDIVRWK